MLLVIGFSLTIFYWAVRVGLRPAQVTEEVAKDAYQLAGID